MTQGISLIIDLQKVRDDYEQELRELRNDRRKSLEQKSRLDAEEIELLLKMRRIDADLSALKKEDA
ncbi:hypothetical protein [Oceanobacillus neutriphilus]|uniref:Uncharacterized protein n=1 Tax=Oceanobacillus neutriphilus TaxID=531815 RepID=A0ABQ2NY72_9BACI|nr:hypothetical protein [Oceanobacillus neutriphilus]GGP13508.1 hypothetical protein GCM10011346_33780 [Oceanobacillus neutriphilus]